MRSGASRLPYYCAPLVCVSEVIESLAVWRYNKPKTKNLVILVRIRAAAQHCKRLKNTKYVSKVCTLLSQGHATRPNSNLYSLCDCQMWAPRAWN